MSHIGYGPNLAVGFGSKRLDVRRPTVASLLISLAGGSTLLLLSIVSFVMSLNYFRDTYVAYRGVLQGRLGLSLVDIFFLMSLLVFASIYGVALLWAFFGSLAVVGKSLRDLLQPPRLANIPTDFREYGDVTRAFKERVISHYRHYVRSLAGSLLGPNSIFLSPTSKMVVTRLGKDLQGRILWLVWLLIVFGCLLGGFSYLSSEGGYQVLRQVPIEIRLLLQQSGRPTLLVPLAVIFGLHCVLAILEVMGIFLMTPTQPNTVAHEGSEYYRGFGHPAQLFARLPDLAIPLRWNDFINRVWPSQSQQWEETASKSVGDVGGFQGRIFIEQQPQPILTLGRMAGYLLFVSGWLFIVLGLTVLLFVLPLPLRQPGLLSPLTLLLIGLIGSTAALGGRELRRNGQHMLDIAHFRSIGILIEFIGSLSRADVRVGKAMIDSIESSNVTVRSDFTARFWAAEIISETPSLPGVYPLTAPREILSLNQNDEAAYWLQFFRSEINKLRSEGVKPVGVELVSDEVQNLVNANVGVSALRSGAMEKAELQTANETQRPLLKEQTQAASSPDGGAPATRFCPQCGQPAASTAKFCRFCGYRLEE